MVSKVQIFNRALNLLGQDEISSIDEVNKRTKALNSAWDMVVEELMYSEPWLFTIKEVYIARLEEDGIYDYPYAYTYPADCLALLEPIGDDVLVRVLGNKIYSNTDGLKIEYIQSGVTIDKWIRGFSRCVSYLLAIESSYRLLESTKRETALTEVYYNKVLPDSTARDAQQQQPRRLYSQILRIASDS